MDNGTVGVENGCFALTGRSVVGQALETYLVFTFKKSETVYLTPGQFVA